MSGGQGGAAAPAAGAAAPAPEPLQPAVAVHRLRSAGTASRPRFLGAALGSGAPESAGARPPRGRQARQGELREDPQQLVLQALGRRRGRAPRAPRAPRARAARGFQQPSVLPPQPGWAAAHPAFPLFLREGIIYLGRRKGLTSFPSTSVRRKFSVRRVIGPRSSTRCPSSVWSFMTWPTFLSMVTLQIMSVPSGPRMWAALPSSLDRRNTLDKGTC